jgi:alpha-1,2-mannosyltransferase
VYATPSRRFSGFLRRHGLATALVTLLFVLSIHYFVKVRHGHQETRSAILRWQNQVIALLDDIDIWDRFDYPNPPIMALLLAPLMHLPPLLCSLVWFYLKCAMVVVSVHWVFRMVETPQTPFPAAGKLLALALGLRPILGDLTHGNVNLFILFLVVASLYAFSRQRDLSAGLLLGLAIACKLTPALFVPYFIWKRAWRALAGCTLGFVLFFGLIPGLFLGMQRNAVFLESWVQRMVRPYVVDGIVTSEHTNQSLPGLAYRLGQHLPSFTMYTSHGYVPTEYHNLVDLNPSLIAWCLKGCMGLFVLLVMRCCRTPPGQRSGWPVLAEFSIIALGMLLFSERTWKHHCVTLLLPFTVLAYCLVTGQPKRSARRRLVAALVAVAALMTATATVPGLERWGKLAEVYGAYVWAYLVLLSALAALLWRRQTAADTAAAGPARFAVLAFRFILIKYSRGREPMAGADVISATVTEAGDGEVGLDSQRRGQHLSARGDRSVP